MTPDERTFIATIVRIHAKLTKLKARLAKNDGMESVPSASLSGRASG